MIVNLSYSITPLKKTHIPKIRPLEIIIIFISINHLNLSYQ